MKKAKKEKEVNFFEVTRGRLKSKKKSSYLDNNVSGQNLTYRLDVAPRPAAARPAETSHPSPTLAAEEAISFICETGSLNESWCKVDQKERPEDSLTGAFAARPSSLATRPKRMPKSIVIASSASTSVSAVDNNSFRDSRSAEKNAQHDDEFDFMVVGDSETGNMQSEIYSIELIRLRALVPLNNSFTEFAFPGFDKIKKCLLINQYYTIKRKAVKLLSVAEPVFLWLYICSCHGSNGTFLKELPTELDCTEQELEEFYKICEHGNAVVSP